MTGGAYTNTAFVPPNGSAGGYPGGAGWWTLLRNTNIVELLDEGVYPTEEAVQGKPQGGPSQSASLVFARGDVYHVIHGGGGGVGDPLLRDPEAVREDVRAGYVSADLAREIYGVALTDEGELDDAATREQRASVRTARLGHAPTREPVADASPFAPLRAETGRWQCGQCGEDLGAQGENWRAAAVSSEQEVSKRFEQLRLRVRPRVEGEPVVVREHFCPACASSLAVDITLAGSDVVAASRIGVNDPYAAVS
jgi:N-methylhydantoinase B